MAFLTTDYKENKSNDYGVLPTGNYEMIIAKAQETATKNGAESLQLDLIVRNDLDGVPALAETNKKYHNRHVFMDNWKRKATSQYDMQGFQYILDAIGVPEGTQINSIDDFLSVLTGKVAKVFVKKGKNEYNGNATDINQVAPWNFSKSDYPQSNHQFKEAKQVGGDDPFANKGQAIDISNDDLPF
ncbi:conserved protein of unknown function [Latilactobacillus sakei]|uniref:DUF669 domain-containing protein n=1 Tax=Latilactobacillus sakei TaxID=1599 RepID=UPI000C6F3F7A|nr:DUF669 domain-containing protein [Latilactobacillus sakei]SON66805.1 conserved protein of unknown function [Latilactobacillus sakei]